jgi:hypothetical protein
MIRIRIEALHPYARIGIELFARPCIAVRYDLCEDGESNLSP